MFVLQLPALIAQEEIPRQSTQTSQKTIFHNFQSDLKPLFRRIMFFLLSRGARIPMKIVFISVSDSHPRCYVTQTIWIGQLPLITLKFLSTIATIQIFTQFPDPAVLSLNTNHYLE